jgi:hypothetical protein
MSDIHNNIVEAERGGLLDLGKALRRLITSGGGGGGGIPATTTDFHEGTSTDKFISPSVFFASHVAANLSDQATITVNMTSALNFVVILGGNRHFANPINVKVGQDGILLVQQDAVGGHQPTWDANWRFNGPPTLYDGPHAWTLIRYWAQTPTIIRCTIEGGSSSAIPAASVAEIREGLEALKYISPAALIEADAAVTLVDAPTIDIDLGLGRNFDVTLGGNRTMGQPLDQMPGRSGDIVVRQDATGSRQLSWHTDWKFLDGTPTLPSAAQSAATFRYRVTGIGNVQVTPQPIAAKVADYWSGASPNVFLSPSVASAGLVPITLVDAATVTPDLSQGFIFSLTIAGDRFIANPINQKPQTGFFYIKQDEVGGRSLSWGSHYKFLGGLPPVIPTDPGATTIVPYYVMSVGEIVCSSVDSTGSGGGGNTGIIAATATETKEGLNATKYVSPFALSGFFSPSFMTDGITLSPNLNNGTVFVVTLGGNRTVANISNQRIGFSGAFIFIQDATGNRTLTWGTNYTFQGGTPVLTTAPNSWTIIPYVIQDFGVIRCISPQISAIPPPASVAAYRAGTSTTTYISPSVATAGNAPVDLVDGATISVNLALGRTFRVTLEGNRAFANPTNQIAGQSGVFIIRQDAVGGRVPTWGNQYFTDGDPVAIGQNPNQKTVVAYLVEADGLVHIG